MSDLKIRELKIQEKRKSTPWREFLKLASRYPCLFYKKDKLFSRYHPENGRGENIISPKEYYENIDTFTQNYTVSYSGDFFEDIKQLLKIVPLCSIKNVGENPNTDYGDIIFNAKNVYLSSVVLSSENVMYSFQVKKSNNVYNSVMVWDGCENISFSRGVTNSYNIFYSSYIKNSYDIRLSVNMIGCNNCINCSNLTNQSYCIENKQYTKEEYENRKEMYMRNKVNFLKRYQNILAIPGENIGSEPKNGQGNIMCEDIENAYRCFEVKKGRNIFLVGGQGTSENMYDVFSGGMEANNHFYGVMGAGYHTEHIYCSAEVAINSSHCYYSFNLENCSYCLGCMSLKNKSFCILNKQYTKEERFELANKIFQQMDSDGILGDFFPGSINPFYFNDTIAYLIDDTFTKEEVEKEGYLRRDAEIKIDIPEGSDVIAITDLNNYQGYNDDGKRKIDTNILKKVIKDEKGNYYRIMQMELDFLQKYGLPLPEIHRLERIRLGFKFK